MAILEKEVWVTLHPNNVNHFEGLGYEIPRRKDKNGILRFCKGSKMLVRVDDLLMGGGQKLTKVCDICGKHIPNQVYDTILKVRKDGKDRCKKCGLVKGGIDRKNSVVYEKSFEYCAKRDGKEYLLKEFSDNNIRIPSKITYHSNDKFLWGCDKCNSEYVMPLNHRVNKEANNCPYCSGHKVLKGYNDIWTTHPDIAKLLKNPQIGYEVSHGSNKKEVFKCNECGNESIKMIANVVNQGYISCPKCGDGISSGEKIMYSILDQTMDDFEIQKVFNWSKNKRYDFYIHSLKCVIEIHGEQHYTYTGFKRTTDEEKENDALKKKLAMENGIEIYIVIDCSRSEFQYLKTSIMNSNLDKIVNLDKINWNKCFEFSCKSLVKQVCSMWGIVVNSDEIAKQMKISNVTVRDYLKKGTKLGWCDYDPMRERNKGLSVGRVNKRKEIIQLTMEGKYVKHWNSATEAAKTLGISQSHISSVCLGKKNSIGGFKWMHKDD